MGKIYDDRGNRMSPCDSTKNGVRYRFYVSSALPRGRTAEAGSPGRVSATDIENAVRIAASGHFETGGLDQTNDAPDAIAMVERVVVAQDNLSISFSQFGERAMDKGATQIAISWSVRPKTLTGNVERDAESIGEDNESLVRAIARAHAWQQSFQRALTGRSRNLPRQKDCIQKSSVRRFGWRSFRQLLP
jgi:site-specific DNA recombinase